MTVTAIDKVNLTEKCDLLVLGFSKKISKDSLFKKFDAKLKGDLSKLIKKNELKGKAGESKLVYTKGKLNADYVLLCGLDDATLEDFRNTGSCIHKTAHANKLTTATIAVLDESSVDAGEAAGALTEGLDLGSYQFDEFFKKKPKKTNLKSKIYADSKNIKAARAAIKQAKVVCEGVNLARDLVNLPAYNMTPVELGKRAQKLSGITVKVHNYAAIKKMKMGAFLSVARGTTEHPPVLIEMHYKPKTKAKKKIALVGKGVTFDTGGYSLKPPKAMDTMKCDMAGAAAVIGLMSTLAKTQPNVEVSGYVAATENVVSGHAQKPGDVCIAMDGTSIEVMNTDAEGRLTLADALLYAQKQNPDVMIDMATLTGACMVALGQDYSAIMANNQELAQELLSISEGTGENLWQLPLPDAYKKQLKSPIADLQNIGGPYGGTITAGLFLKHFVKDKVKWAHLDIAGPSFLDAPKPYCPKGGTGVMVRTLSKYVHSL